VDVLRCADLSVQRVTEEQVEGVWRRAGYGGGTWQVSGGRGRPVVSGLHGDPDRRAKDTIKFDAESGPWEQNGGALRHFENGSKIAEAVLVGRASLNLPGYRAIR
jgi:hypothetical protein